MFHNRSQRFNGSMREPLARDGVSTLSLGALSLQMDYGTTAGRLARRGVPAVMSHIL